MSTVGLGADADDVVQSAQQARDAIEREDWGVAELSLTEVQERVGRLLREVGDKVREQLQAPPTPGTDVDDDRKRQTGHGPPARRTEGGSRELGTAIASAENTDWAAAEQGVIDVEQRLPTILRELQLKLAEPPTVGGGEVDD